MLSYFYLVEYLSVVNTKSHIVDTYTYLTIYQCGKGKYYIVL